MLSIKEYSTLYNELIDNEEYKRSVKVSNDEWEFDEPNVADYMPQPNHITVTVGVNHHKSCLLKNFECINLSDAMPHKKGFVINTGGAIWGLDFVPQPANDMQYLTVGGYNTTTEHHTFNEDTTQPNAIQIWKWGFNEQQPQLDACILHTLGVVVDMKWCPLNFYDTHGMMGVLAILLNTGKIAILVVPHPDLIRQEQKKDNSCVFLKVKTPRLVLTLPRTSNTCFAWGGHGLLASGTTAGSIVVWDILASMSTQKTVVNVNLHNASLVPIQMVTWRSLFDTHTILATDVDGNINLYDLQDPFIPFRITRVRNLYTYIIGAGHGSGFIYTDTDGIVRKTSGYDSKQKLTLTSHNCHVWSISTSPHHGVMASVSSDGYAKIKSLLNYTRRNKSPEYTLYILEHNKETNVFQFIDGIQPTTDTPDREVFAVFTDPIQSLNKIVWNSNKSASGWIASGGTAGLCRLEFTGL